MSGPTPGGPAAALALAALLVTAGCSAIGGGDGGGATLTPAPVPTDTPEPTPVPTVAPGVSRQSVVSVWDLAGTHRRTLEATSYTTVKTIAVMDGERTLQSFTRRVRVAPGGDPYLLRQRYERAEDYPITISPARRVRLWYDNGSGAFRLGGPDGTRYVGDEAIAAGGLVTDNTEYKRLGRLLSGFELRVTGRVDAREDTRYRIESDRLRRRSALRVPPALTDPRNATITVLVSPEGVVRRYVLAYNASYEGESVRVVQTFRVSAVGSTTVREPAWVEQANATASANATLPSGGVGVAAGDTGTVGTESTTG